MADSPCRHVSRTELPVITQEPGQPLAPGLGRSPGYRGRTSAGQRATRGTHGYSAIFGRRGIAEWGPTNAVLQQEGAIRSAVSPATSSPSLSLAETTADLVLGAYVLIVLFG